MLNAAFLLLVSVTGSSSDKVELAKKIFDEFGITFIFQKAWMYIVIVYILTYFTKRTIERVYKIWAIKEAHRRNGPRRRESDLAIEKRIKFPVPELFFWAALGYGIGVMYLATLVKYDDGLPHWAVLGLLTGGFTALLHSAGIKRLINPLMEVLVGLLVRRFGIKSVLDAALHDLEKDKKKRAEKT